MTLDKAAATANAALNIEWWQGLRNGNLMLHYQPQMACDGRMSGVEALVRWCAGALAASAERSGIPAGIYFSG